MGRDRKEAVGIGRRQHQADGLSLFIQDRPTTVLKRCRQRQ